MPRLPNAQSSLTLPIVPVPHPSRETLSTTAKKCRRKWNALNLETLVSLHPVDPTQNVKLYTESLPVLVTRVIVEVHPTVTPSVQSIQTVQATKLVSECTVKIPAEEPVATMPTVGHSIIRPSASKSRLHLFSSLLINIFLHRLIIHQLLLLPFFQMFSWIHWRPLQWMSIGARAT